MNCGSNYFADPGKVNSQCASATSCSGNGDRGTCCLQKCKIPSSFSASGFAYFIGNNAGTYKNTFWTKLVDPGQSTAAFPGSAARTTGTNSVLFQCSSKYRGTAKYRCPSANANLVLSGCYEKCSEAGNCPRGYRKKSTPSSKNCATQAPGNCNLSNSGDRDACCHANNKCKYTHDQGGSNPDGCSNKWGRGWMNKDSAETLCTNHYCDHSSDKERCCQHTPKCSQGNSDHGRCDSAGWHYDAARANYRCWANACSDSRDLALCCNRNAQCKTFGCGDKNGKKYTNQNGNSYCQGATCNENDRAICCVENEMCDDHSCPAGYARSPSASDISCLSKSCSSSDNQRCCVKRCDQAFCNGYTWGADGAYFVKSGSPKCGGYSCGNSDLNTCCEKGCEVAQGDKHGYQLNAGQNWKKLALALPPDGNWKSVATYVSCVSSTHTLPPGKSPSGQCASKEGKVALFHCHEKCTLANACPLEAGGFAVIPNQYCSRHKCRVGGFAEAGTLTASAAQAADEQRCCRMTCRHPTAKQMCSDDYAPIETPVCSGCGTRPMESWSTCNESGYCSKCNSPTGRRGASCRLTKSTKQIAQTDPPECKALNNVGTIEDWFHSDYMKRTDDYHSCVLLPMFSRVKPIGDPALQNLLCSDNLCTPMKYYVSTSERVRDVDQCCRQSCDAVTNCGQSYTPKASRSHLLCATADCRIFEGPNLSVAAKSCNINNAQSSANLVVKLKDKIGNGFSVNLNFNNKNQERTASVNMGYAGSFVQSLNIDHSTSDGLCLSSIKLNGVALFAGPDTWFDDPITSTTNRYFSTGGHTWSLTDHDTCCAQTCTGVFCATFPVGQHGKYFVKHGTPGQCSSTVCGGTGDRDTCCNAGCKEPSSTDASYVVNWSSALQSAAMDPGHSPGWVKSSAIQCNTPDYRGPNPSLTCAGAGQDAQYKTGLNDGCWASCDSIDCENEFYQGDGHGSTSFYMRTKNPTDNGYCTTRVPQSDTGCRDNDCCQQVCRYPEGTTKTEMLYGYVFKAPLATDRETWKPILQASGDRGRPTSTTTWHTVSDDFFSCATSHQPQGVSSTVQMQCPSEGGLIKLQGCKEACTASALDCHGGLTGYLQKRNPTSALQCQTNHCDIQNAADVSTCCIRSCQEPEHLWVKAMFDVFPNWTELLSDPSLYPESGAAFKSATDLTNYNAANFKFQCNAGDFVTKTAPRLRCTGPENRITIEPDGCVPKCKCTGGTEMNDHSCPAPHAERCASCTANMNHVRIVPATDDGQQAYEPGLRHLWETSDKGDGQYYENRWCWPMCKHVACLYKDSSSKAYFQDRLLLNAAGTAPQTPYDSINWCNNRADGVTQCKQDGNCCRLGCKAPTDKTGYAISSWENALQKRQLYPAEPGILSIKFLSFAFKRRSSHSCSSSSWH
ncbi:unnamed protein product [Amoebophrya sp. A120]|nr:unnamed protein product [Amoebophrya sp. A120]|eukprot:GSA120T00009915001.1